MRGLGALLGLAVSVWLLSNCQSIIGIKDYTLVTANAECGNYCDLAQASCGGGDSGAYSSIYTSRDTCTAVCGYFDPNPDHNSALNTLGCREGLLLGQEPMDCPKAGPGGGKPPLESCGTNCDSYCSLYSKICPTQFSKEFGGDSGTPCADACNALPDYGGYNVASDDTGATVQCRFFHLSAAAAAGIDSPECLQSGLRPVDKCTDVAGSDAFCNNFCTYALNACPESLAVYENKTQCFNVCKAMPPGTEKNDISHNTMICRAYHISNVLLISRTLHCPHIGPGGDGHCGPDVPASMATGNCESYCLLLEKACDKPSADRAQCEQACNDVPGAPLNSGYTVSPAADAGAGSGAPLPGTLQCRLLHLARALEHPATSMADCTAALGGGECAATMAN